MGALPYEIYGKLLQINWREDTGTTEALISLIAPALVSLKGNKFFRKLKMS